MNNVAWQTEHSVEAIASPPFAWAYMTDVANWDDPPAQFRLEEPFATGGRGTTEMPGQPARHWHLRDVKPIESYTIEFPLAGAMLSFAWRFSEIPEHRTRLTQRVTLEGENASEYLADIQQAFRSSLAPGMNKIVAAMNQAYTGNSKCSNTNDGERCAQRNSGT
jgi:polyketide cyclase/dehydrase/lipid transport protein